MTGGNYYFFVVKLISNKENLSVFGIRTSSLIRSNWIAFVAALIALYPPSAAPAPRAHCPA